MNLKLVNCILHNLFNQKNAFALPETVRDNKNLQVHNVFFTVYLTVVYEAVTYMRKGITGFFIHILFRISAMVVELVKHHTLKFALKFRVSLNPAGVIFHMRSSESAFSPKSNSIAADENL